MSKHILGGQTFDTGYLEIESTGIQFKVSNCQAYAGYIVHSGFLTTGSISVGDKVKVLVDYDRRGFIAPNHTMVFRSLVSHCIIKCIIEL